MRVDVITIFPDMFTCGPLQHSMMKRASEAGIITVNAVDLRDFAQHKHNKVDDTPYGGGAGMVMKPEPFFRAVDYVNEKSTLDAYAAKGHVILFAPVGQTLTQARVKELARHEHLILLCGHYEGVDERVAEHLADECISIGDYVLTGGELPAMVLIDAIARMLPGVLGDKESAVTDSFYDGLLGYPQYTKPRIYRTMEVPEVLVSGHHKNIEAWRKEQALQRTKLLRPDLLEQSK